MTFLQICVLILSVLNIIIYILVKTTTKISKIGEKKYTYDVMTPSGTQYIIRKSLHWSEKK